MCVVAESQSLTRAASVLGLTQPALAAQLQRIEKLLGGPLFEHGPAGTKPTALGREVIALAGQILSKSEQLVALAQGSRRSAAAPALTLGCEPNVFLADCLAQLRAVMAGSEVKVRVDMHAEHLLDMLADDRIHLAVLFDFVGMDTLQPRGIELRELITEPVWVMIAETHPLAGQDEIDLVDLAEFDWVSLPPGMDSNRQGLDAACAAAGFAARRTHYATEVSTARSLVRAGAVAASVPGSTGAEGIVVRPLRGDPCALTLHVATRTEGPFADRRRELFAAVARGYRASVDRSPGYAKWWADNPHRHAEIDAAIALAEVLEDGGQQHAEHLRYRHG